MAISYRGTARSHVITGNDATIQNLFSIENGVQSRVKVYVRAINVSADDIVALAVVTPVFRVFRATAISGGQLVEKTPFDTNQTSDNGVVIRAALLEMARISATPGTAAWQKFDNRMHTAIEQQRPNIGKSILPTTVEDIGKEFVLRPGESLLVQVVSAAGTSNPALANSYFAEVHWDEDPLPTFAIGGTITLGGNPVTGAKVMVIEADDNILTNAFLREVITTPAGGAWSSNIRTGKVGAAFVQYTNGGIYYTAPGSPFLS
jgi:hypothetical protein